MPCITLTTHLERGATFPVRVSSVMDHGKVARCRAALSITQTDSIICPSLARVLEMVPMGTTDLVLPHRVIHDVPFHIIDIRLTVGMLGHPIERHIVRRVIVLESARDMGVGIVLGMNFVALGSLTFSAETITFCV